MAAHPIGPRSAGQPPQWYTSSSTFNRSYLMAALRAGLIALALLVVLALIVLT